METKMLKKFLSSFLFLLLPIIAQASSVAILEIDINSYQMNMAVQNLGLDDTVSARFHTLEDLRNSDEAKDYVQQSSVIFVNVMMTELADYLIENDLVGGHAVYALNQSADPEKLEKKGFLFDTEVMEYYHNLTVGNIINMVRMGVNRHIDASVSYQEVEKQPEICLYHPASEKKYEQLKDYLSWYTTRANYRAENSRIGITFYGSTLKEGQIEAAGKLVTRLEDAGFTVLPFFGPIQKVMPTYLKVVDGKAPVDLLLSFTLKFASAINEDIKKGLEELNVPLFNVIRPYSGTIDEWRESPIGMGPMETVWGVATPEQSGAIEPSVLIGKKEHIDPVSGKKLYTYDTIEESIDFLIPRLQKWAALQTMANSEKKVAILYYNHSQGKQNIAAAYLNVFRSLEQILARMKVEGYSIENSEILSEKKLQDMVLDSGRNVGSWAPGELDNLIASGGTEQVALEEYRRWFNELPEQFKRPVLEQWGDPEECAIMTDGGKLIFPMVKLGNIVLLPEPARGWSDEPMKLYHDTTLYPHHQYIAAYLWLAKNFHADAMVHLGTHATYEWLPGKQAGLAPSDPPEIMVGDIPNIYPYIVDDIGEGIEAKRRGRGVVLDHLTPPMMEADLYSEYAEIHKIYHKYEIARANGSETVSEYRKSIYELVEQLGLMQDLGITDMDDEAMEKIHLYLHEIDNNSLPYGLHTYGKPYDDEATASTLKLIVKQNPDADAKQIEHDLLLSAKKEMDNFIAGLNGRYVEPGEGNDPLRNLAAIPTGRNFYGFSPAKVPSKAAWEIGKRAAIEMIKQKLEKEGKYPRKVGVVLWATETERNEGVNESTILYLMGVEPIWDASEKVTGSRVIPGKVLGRPRIDVLINPSGLYRDMFPNKLIYLDEAVQKAMAQNDIENFLAGNQQVIKKRLLEQGLSDEDAEMQSRFRIFTEEVGSYGNGVAEMTSSSPLWDSDEDVSNVYLNRVQFAVGQGKWGVPVKKAFSENLRDVDIAVHSRSTNVIGVIDTDDFFMYLGGMSLAVKNITGKAPDTMVTMHRKKDELMVEDVAKTIGREMRTRYLNPQWIKGMQKDNYAGARQMADFAENLWGWQVTVTDAVGEDKWQQVFEVYVEDKYDMDIAEFFNEHSPWAYQSMTARMLETVRKEYWKPAESVIKKLAVEYATNVVKKGVACCDHTCNNPMLNEMVMNIISVPGVMTPEMVQQFKLAIEKMAKKSLEQQTADRKQLLATLGEAPGEKSPKAEQAKQEQTTPQNKTDDSKQAEVEGYKMEDMNSDDTASSLSSSGIQWIASIFILVIVLLFFLGLRKRR